MVSERPHDYALYALNARAIVSSTNSDVAAGVDDAAVAAPGCAHKSIQIKLLNYATADCRLLFDSRRTHFKDTIMILPIFAGVIDV